MDCVHSGPSMQWNTKQQYEGTNNRYSPRIKNFQKSSAKWKKPDLKDYILYTVYSIFRIFWKSQIYRDRNQSNDCQGLEGRKLTTKGHERTWECNKYSWWLHNITFFKIHRPLHQKMSGLCKLYLNKQQKQINVKF